MVIFGDMDCHLVQTAIAFINGYRMRNTKVGISINRISLDAECHHGGHERQHNHHETG